MQDSIDNSTVYWRVILGKYSNYYYYYDAGGIFFLLLTIVDTNMSLQEGVFMSQSGVLESTFARVDLFLEWVATDLGKGWQEELVNF